MPPVLPVLPTLTVLLGGARSGKSALAVELARCQSREVVYVATATALDDEMAARIARHRAERPGGWTTLEEPLDLVGALERGHDAMVVVDCLTLWTSNLLELGAGDEEVVARATTAAARAAGRDAPTVAISNEVGMGVHPETALGRRYRDVLGRVNQVWAAAADASLLLVAGRAIRLDDPWHHLAGSP